MFKKSDFDHEEVQGVNSTSNLAITLEVRCSCSFAYTPLLLLRVLATFSVLKTVLFEHEL